MGSWDGMGYHGAVIAPLAGVQRPPRPCTIETPRFVTIVSIAAQLTPYPTVSERLTRHSSRSLDTIMI